MSQLVDTFKILVSEQFGQLPADKKASVINVTQQLAMILQKMLPNAPRDEREQYGPIFQQLLGSMKRIGIWKEEHEKQEQQQTDAVPPQPAPRSSHQQQQGEKASIAQPMMQLIQTFQLLVSENFSKLPDDKKSSII